MAIAFSCHTWGFNDLTLPEAMGTIARLGFRYVDIGTGPHLNASRAAHPQTIKQVIAALRADLSTFHLQFGDLYAMLPAISADSEERRRTEIRLYKAMLVLAKAAGALGVTVSPGLVHPPDDEAAWDRTVASLREMQAAADQVALPLSIEPHPDSMAQTPEQALELIAAVPGLQITLDWAHLVYQKVKPAAVEPLLPHTRHVHIRQAAPRKLQVPFDKGRIDAAEVIRMLHAAGYDGLICVAYLQGAHPPYADGHGVQAVSSIAACARMRDVLREARDALANAPDS